LIQTEKISAESNLQQDEIVEPEPLFEIQAREQKELAEKFEEEQRNYNILNHDFYENEVVRIYNNTAYQFDNAENKLMSGESDNLGFQNFAISFGYGMEFKLDKIHKVGYEYVSNFPYDRGQIIRLFWLRSF
jgi:hypothetical protein